MLLMIKLWTNFRTSSNVRKTNKNYLQMNLKQMVVFTDIVCILSKIKDL